ncbi:hypothetical protein [Gynuella sunshinyii]|uniref:Uncharacterized protein n=1 Tax=Gynuella sunshinyii YC6258 TaxID=1445510 RepID=A0A0C5VDI7_9GAMM|nr:hypothetical protein [Gynuella sunshinyii]AJQ92251.1 hypothetical Protein YC6258_00199 [Gynuella sunshinyii YC6258]AJQ95802.1 hypothetical Protein YC6258_03766 [Gynuella sunshinyii YC6258]
MKLFGLGKAAERAAKVIDDLVTDKDLANRLRAEVYMTELQAQTVPWVDAVHKMGRQFLAYAQIGFYAWAVAHGVEINAELVAGVSGVAGIYAIAKGRGQ